MMSEVLSGSGTKKSVGHHNPGRQPEHQSGHHPRHQSGYHSGHQSGQFDHYPGYNSGYNSGHNSRHHPGHHSGHQSGNQFKVKTHQKKRHWKKRPEQNEHETVYLQ